MVKIKFKNLALANQLKYIGFILIFLVPVILLLLPADYFDSGESMCLSVVLANTECYGCGLTRGIQHLMHFEFETAWEYNKLSFLILPLAVYMVLFEFVKFRKSLVNS